MLGPRLESSAYQRVVAVGDVWRDSGVV